MRVLVQRVKRAEVRVGGEVAGRIGPGLLVFAGIMEGDTEADLAKMARKTVALRIFDDEAGTMNLPVTAVEGGGMLAVSQFTLCAETAKGNRPSYIRAMRPEAAKGMFGRFTELLRESGVRVETGVFQAEMDVELVNDGPVTLWLDSRGP